MNLRTLTICWLVTLLSPVGFAAGAVLYVDDDSPGGDGTSWATAFDYFQDALAVADANDEIRVAQGTYVADQNSVNPGGTGKEMLVISARLAPFPPNSSFILPCPSPLPPPKKYTIFFIISGSITPAVTKARKYHTNPQSCSADLCPTVESAISTGTAYPTQRGCNCQLPNQNRNSYLDYMSGWSINSALYVELLEAPPVDI